MLEHTAPPQATIILSRYNFTKGCHHLTLSGNTEDGEVPQKWLPQKWLLQDEVA